MILIGIKNYQFLHYKNTQTLKSFVQSVINKNIVYLRFKTSFLQNWTNKDTYKLRQIQFI